MDPPQTYDGLVAANNQLRTRVSELEVINDLFRGRVDELESSEREARRSENAKQDEVKRLQEQLDAANTKVAQLEQRLAEDEVQDEPERKRKKMEVGRTDD